MAARKTPAPAPKKTLSHAPSKPPAQPQSKTPTQYKFSFGPWNISTGADPFGPPVRKEMEYAQKLKAYKKLGFDAVQFHDDDIVSGRSRLAQHQERVADVKKVSRTAKGCSSRSSPRGSGKIRARSTAPSHPTTPAIASTHSIGLAGASISPERSAARTTCSGWPAKAPTSAKPSAPRPPSRGSSRPGTRSSSTTRKSASWAKPSPMSRWTRRICPRSATWWAWPTQTIDPARSGVLIESAHSILAGLDPADDMAYALYHNKLWSVHLNDQNGLKFDQDKVFGSVDLRRAFNQIWVLEKNGFGRSGECVGPRRQGHAHDHVRGINLSPLALEDDVPPLARRRSRHRRTQGRRAAHPSQVRATGDVDLECASWGGRIEGTRFA